MNQVERWLAELQRRCLERGVFCSLDKLTTALEQWIKLWNQSAQPFGWTKTPDQIIDRICRYCARISTGTLTKHYHRIKRQFSKQLKSGLSPLTHVIPGQTQISRCPDRYFCGTPPLKSSTR